MDSADDFQTGRGDIAIDEAYLSYLEEEDDIDVVTKFKRIRFKGVSELNVSKIFDTHFDRMSHCISGRRNAIYLHMRS